MHFWLLFVMLFVVQCRCQVLQLGLCDEVKPVSKFNLDTFLGAWYEVERFPIWYENNGQCAYKVLQRRGDLVELQHHYVRDDIEYVLHVNTTMEDPNKAVFQVEVSNIDTLGIPLTVVATDYTDYAVVYGCKHHEEMHFRFVSAWILSRNVSLAPATLQKARRAVNALPLSSTAYMEPVEHTAQQCSHIWTAHVEE